MAEHPVVNRSVGGSIPSERAFPAAYPEATRRWVLRLYLAEKPIRVIARTCRVSRAYVVTTVKKAGVNRGIPQSRIEARARRDAEIVQRRSDGESIATLATAFDLTTNRIEQIVGKAARSTAPHAGEVVGATAGTP